MLANMADKDLYLGKSGGVYLVLDQWSLMRIREIKNSSGRANASYVYLALMEILNNRRMEKGLCSATTVIRNFTGLGRDVVKAALRDLEEIGVIEIEQVNEGVKAWRFIRPRALWPNLGNGQSQPKKVSPENQSLPQKVSPENQAPYVHRESISNKESNKPYQAGAAGVGGSVFDPANAISGAARPPHMDIPAVFYANHQVKSQYDPANITSAKRLIQMYGRDESVQMASDAVRVSGSSYAPVVKDSADLLKKWVSLKAYLQREKEGSNKPKKPRILNI